MLKSLMLRFSALFLCLLLVAGCGAKSSGSKDDPGDGTTPVVNQPPVALDQSASTQEGTAVAVTLAGTDPEGSALTFFVHGLPSHGTVTGAPPSVTYSPDAGYSGADSFTFSVSDGEKVSNVATVTLAISALPPPPPFGPPTFSPVPSTYSTPQTITLSAAAGASIRYTLDGSNPTQTHGELYTNPFTAGSDVKLKAVAFKGGSVSQLSQAIYRIRVPATGEVDVTILSPNPIEGSGYDTRRIKSVGDSAFVSAQVTAGVELDSVVASVGERTVPLVFKNDVFCWTTSDLMEQCYDGFGGNLDLSGLPVGVMELTVTAVDHVGNEGSKTILITHDAPPTLTILAPAYGATAHPGLRFAATCTDDEGEGCEIHVSSSNEVSVPNVVPPAFDSLDAIGDLSAYSGKTLYLRFSAADKGEHLVFNDTVAIHVEAAQNLESVATVAGEALDFDGGRVLSLIKGEAGQTLRITRVSDGSVQDHALQAGSEVAKDMFSARAFLTPVGAVAMIQGNAPTLTSWENGQTVDLGTGVTPSSLKVGGDWGIWYGGALYRRNFTAGVTEFIADGTGNWNNDVTKTGAVAWWKSGGGIVLRTEEGMREMTDAAWRNVYPQTDGVNAVYLKVSNGHTASPQALAFTDFVTETLLTDFSQPYIAPASYQFGGGRVYFTAPGTLGQAAIWRREQDGAVAKLTFFTNDSSLDSAGPDGTAMIINTSDRYLIGLDGDLTKVSGGLGKTLQIAGQWYLLLGDWVGRYK